MWMITIGHGACILATCCCCYNRTILEIICSVFRETLIDVTILRDLDALNWRWILFPPACGDGGDLKNSIYFVL